MSQSHVPQTALGAMAKAGLIVEASNAVVYKFTVPASIAKVTGVTAIGIAALTAQDELIATQRANGDQFRLGLESVKMALRWVEKNGSRVRISTADSSIDEFWNHSDNVKLRQLAASAMVKVNRPEETEVESFLGSCETIVE